ncbi:hypothetical protein Fcan01_28511 [Folsomia candida]|uniref:C2H2-type domain-containing protein n=1 Tax=Folsomia candida TaxID=158441 RepID=A0A226CVZ4_FOLCA|nr:hypothetical protein Fcan01_28547 [Folsomia candida]OXA36731.1 hypothetical protein Fcan01_28511 [Folsomia candida]
MVYKCSRCSRHFNSEQALSTHKTGFHKVTLFDSDDAETNQDDSADTSFPTKLAPMMNPKQKKKDDLEVEEGTSCQIVVEKGTVKIQVQTRLRTKKREKMIQKVRQVELLVNAVRCVGHCISLTV